MATASLRVWTLTMALGLAHLAADAGSARADADVPKGATFRTAGYAREAAQALQSTTSSNVYVDPRTGTEVYLPTGETIDEVVTVVAERVPAVASVDTRSTPADRPRSSTPFGLLVAVPVALWLALRGPKLWRGRRGRSPRLARAPEGTRRFSGDAARFGAPKQPQTAGL